MSTLKKFVFNTLSEIFKKLEKESITNIDNNIIDSYIFYEQNDIIFVENMPVDKSFNENLQLFGHFCYKYNIINTALITDISMKEISHKEIKERFNNIDEYLNQRDLTDSPLSYPPNLRTDAFMVTFLNFKDEKMYDSQLIPYMLQDKKIIRLEKEEKRLHTYAIKNTQTTSILIGFAKRYIYDHIENKMDLENTLSYEKFIKHLDQAIKEYPSLEYIKHMQG